MKAHPISLIAFSCLTAPLLCACAADADRYPNLNMRDFERVQGAFSAPTEAVEPLRPAPLRIEAVSQLEATVDAAREHHEHFLQQASKAKPIVAAAAGTGVEDNRWSNAQIEIAELESRNGETMSLLAELDSLYAKASLDLQERQQIQAAREQISEYYLAERQVTSELVTLLGPNRAQP